MADRPATADELMDLWDMRDAQYTARRYSYLTEPMITAVKDHRRREIELLPPLERQRALNVWSRWSLPAAALR